MIRVGLAALTLCIVVGLPCVSVAQLVPAPVNIVAGRVIVGGPTERPVPGTWVALNRVADDGAGVVDSVRTGPDGSYRFEFRRTGDPDALYFTDVTYGGVAYFTDPLRSARVVGDDADLVVFDTTSVARTLFLRGRHLVVGAEAEDGRRPIVEVFELTNDTTVTIVPGAGGRAVWSIELPAGAEDLVVPPGDLGPTVVRFVGRRADLVAPFAPGLRQLSINYTLPARAFPLTLRMTQTPDVLEVLLAGTDGEAAGAGLHEEAAVTLEGDSYRRYLSQRVPAGAEITVRARSGGAATHDVVVPVALAATVAAFGGAMLYVRRHPLPAA